MVLTRLKYHGGKAQFTHCHPPAPTTIGPPPLRSALDAVLDDERWGEALEYNRGAPMPHEGE